MLRVPALATAVIVAIGLAWWASATVAGERKLAGVTVAEPRGNYRITLDFAPERFHQVRLQEAGRLVEVRGDDVFMMDVPAPALRGIAREYWVRSIAPWAGK
jgi:hypothetical protein